jgi:hypothetical protein
MTVRDRRKWLAIVLLVELTAGCAVHTDAPSASPDSLAALLSEAEAVGAPPAQIEVLARALSEGRDVGFEEYRETVDLKLDCIRGLGYEVVNVHQVERPGWIEIEFAFGGGADGADLLDPAVEQCRQESSAWIELAYQLNYDPAIADEMIQALLTAMVSCINGFGGAASADSTLEELIAENYEIIDKDPTGTENCLYLTGLVDLLD